MELRYHNSLKSIKCHFENKEEFLRYYSVDASSYQIKPKLVVFPKNIDEIKEIIKFGKKFNLSVTPRGTGTGLVGSSLNDGIIIDLKNFKKIKVKKDTVLVESGVTKGNLDKRLNPYSKFFPPNPSIGQYCSLGGMIANNSSGSHSLKYGSVIDNLKEITFVDGNSNLITLPKNKEYGRKILKICKKINLQKFPCVTKNSCGYRLDSVNSLNDTHKIIAASEGTLGIIVSAKLKIQKKPKEIILVIIGYTNEKTAADDCQNIMKTNPSAVEFVDKKMCDKIPYEFPYNNKCLLFVEFDKDVKKAEKSLKKILTGNIIKINKKESEIKKWWRFRDLSLVHSIKSIPNYKRMSHVIEDGTVPVKKLSKLFFIIEKLNKIFKTDSISYGHVGNGNIHVRLSTKRKNIKNLKKIADVYFSQIIKLKGTITGEHGDGLARSEFIIKQYGDYNYKLFMEMKQLFDPVNILNPGKIISKGSKIAQNLEKF